MTGDKKFYLGILVMFLIIAALGVGFAVVLSQGLQEVGDSLEDACIKKCEGRDQEVASFTAYGCECRDKASE